MQTRQENVKNRFLISAILKLRKFNRFQENNEIFVLEFQQSNTQHKSVILTDC